MNPTLDPMPAGRIRVLLIDDHLLVVDALARVLARERDIEIVGVAGTVRETREFADRAIDVVLMDYRLPDGTGADATRAIKARRPGTRVVMLTGLDDDATVLDSIEAGADGYLTKDRAVEDVVNAVRAAHAGETLLPRSVVLAILKRTATLRDQVASQPTPEPLTAREIEVLGALAQGRSSRVICAQLEIAPNTLRSHLRNIMRKLQVHSKLEAVAFALRHRLVEPPKPIDSSTQDPPVGRARTGESGRAR